MIITCASCLTKYHLENSKIPEKGAKVRCSRCKHVFYVVLPPETKEEVFDNFESFAKYHKELIGQDQKPPPFSYEKEEIEERAERKMVKPEGAEEEEDKYLFSDQSSSKQVGSFSLPKFEEERGAEVEEVRPKKVRMEVRRARGERRMPSRLFILVVVIVILAFGLFYLWTEMESGGEIASYLDRPFQKITLLWERYWETEKEGLVFKDLTGYEEKVGNFTLFIIEGKVDNQSQKTKKHIKVKVALFDQNRTKVAEKEAFCGKTINRGELRSFPPNFFSGELLIQPKTEKERIIPSGKTVPFMILFKDLPAEAKEFKVDIVESPSL